MSGEIRMSSAEAGRKRQTVQKMYFSAMPYYYDDIALLEVYDESGDFQRENRDL